MVKFTTSLCHWCKYIKLMYRDQVLKRRVDLLLSRVPDGAHFLCLLNNLKGMKKAPVQQVASIKSLSAVNKNRQTLLAKKGFWRGVETQTRQAYR